MSEWDAVWIGADLATMTIGVPYGTVGDGAIAVSGGEIAWVGRRADLPSHGAPVHDVAGKWITPGLVDCHTHIVHGGNRAREFEQRLEGATYEEIAKAGGGIRSTVAETRKTSEDDLFEGARRRLVALLAEGVTTVEIKSGYGLDLETECRMLRVARRLGESLPVTVRTSFLGAHALPPEYDGRPDQFIAFVCDEVLPVVAAEGLADACDGFCDTIGFTLAQTERLFEVASILGLPVKLHAEQLSDKGGAQLVARYRGLSADHLEYLSEAGVEAMARAGTVAVMLPGAYYFLRDTKVPPIDLLRRHGVPMAVSTDSNPGSCPTLSLLLILNMACTLFRLTPEEALAGATRNGARALGMDDTHGTLEAGKAADFVVWDIDSPADLAYRMGFNACIDVVKAGVNVLKR